MLTSKGEKNMNVHLQRDIWRFIDQSVTNQQRSPLESFATDDTLCEAVGAGESPWTIRTWVHDASVVLGIQDHRLPHIQDAMLYLQQNGYTPIVRNSGGLAVVLDSGILNISLIMAEEDTRVSIDDGYEAMVELIRLLFPEAATRIQAYEIVGSYCPGSYDLSIDGKKFAGISQRRMRQGIAVQIYLCIEGSGSERAALIRDFYTEGLQGEDTKFTYPVVTPHVMASLSELLQLELTVTDVMHRLQHVMSELAKEVRYMPFTAAESKRYMHYLTRIFERNDKMLNI